MKIKQYMTSCDDATSISDKDQYGEASTWEKMKLGFHIMMCKSCKVYTVQNKIVTKAFDKIALIEMDKDYKLSDDEKAEIKKRLENKLSC